MISFDIPIDTQCSLITFNYSVFPLSPLSIFFHALQEHDYLIRPHFFVCLVLPSVPQEIRKITSSPQHQLLPFSHPPSPTSLDFSFCSGLTRKAALWDALEWSCGWIPSLLPMEPFFDSLCFSLLFHLVSETAKNYIYGGVFLNPHIWN